MTKILAQGIKSSPFGAGSYDRNTVEEHVLVSILVRTQDTQSTWTIRQNNSPFHSFYWYISSEAGQPPVWMTCNLWEVEDGCKVEYTGKARLFLLWLYSIQLAPYGTPPNNCRLCSLCSSGIDSTQMEANDFFVSVCGYSRSFGMTIIIKG